MSALTSALIQQFNAMNASINVRFDAQTAAIRAQFEDTNIAVTSLTVTVQSQGQNIKEIKERLGNVEQRMESGFETIDKRFGTF